MPSNRCSICGVSWPTKYGKCPTCERPTDYISNVQPDHDWEDMLASGEQRELPDTQAIKIAQNKLERYLVAGLDYERALRLAGDRDADLQLFEKLAADPKCGVDLAFDIVRGS